MDAVGGGGGGDVLGDGDGIERRDLDEGAGEAEEREDGAKGKSGFDEKRAGRGMVKRAS